MCLVSCTPFSAQNNTDSRTELDDREKKVAAYKELVLKLPQANWSLLRALSAFLISIVNNSEVNKMTVRNGKRRVS